jgi:glutathione synthase/RimK-type ligase-like ATP-grasp enzyme
MTTRKTDLDITREQIAHRVASNLHGAGVYGIDVCHGGRRGLYVVTVNGLNRPKMERMVAAIRAELERMENEKP